MLGLKFPTEPTSTLAVAIMMMSAHRGPTSAMKYDARACYSVLLGFKRVCRNICKNGFVNELKAFPSDAKDLPADPYNAAPQLSGVKSLTV